MDTEDFYEDLVMDLDSDIYDADVALKPYLAIAERASKLPLLDRAKFYVNAAYNIESLIYSILRLDGGEIQAHPVANELKRVRQYYAKISKIEEAGEEASAPAPRARLDKEAAVRFINADLPGNPELKKLSKQLKETNERAAAASASSADPQKGAKRRRVDGEAADRLAKRIASDAESVGTPPKQGKPDKSKKSSRRKWQTS